jgi:hypothetical protein
LKKKQIGFPLQSGLKDKGLGKKQTSNKPIHLSLALAQIKNNVAEILKIKTFLYDIPTI